MNICQFTSMLKMQMGKQNLFVVPEIALAYNKGLKRKDLKLAEKIINENKEIIISRWNEYHGE